MTGQERLIKEQPSIFVALTLLAFLVIFRLSLWPFSLYPPELTFLSAYFLIPQCFVMEWLHITRPIDDPRFKHIPWMSIPLTGASVAVLLVGADREPFMYFNILDFVSQVAVGCGLMVGWAGIIAKVIVETQSRRIAKRWGLIGLWGGIVSLYLYFCVTGYLCNMMRVDWR